MIDVKPEYLEIIKSILRINIPDFEVWAFGSRITGKPKSYSDLDLVIKGKTKLPLNKLALLKMDFEESDLPFRVDILDWNRISPEFQSLILKGFEVIQKPN